LTIREAARELRMSEAWLRQKIFRKEIRHLKIGRRVFILQATLEKLLDDSVVEPRTKEKRDGSG